MCALSNHSAERSGFPITWLRAIARLGITPDDTEAERLEKESLTLVSVSVSTLATLWVVTYWTLGLERAAVIPLAYQIASLISLAHFMATKSYRLFRMGQLLLMLLLPFFLQWTLGGYTPSSAVSIWALLSPIGALTFSGARESVKWFVAYIALCVLSGFLEGPLTSSEADLIPSWLRAAFFVGNIGAASGTSFLMLVYFVREREKARAAVDRLLLNILPSPIAERLKAGEQVIADNFDEVTVLFADIVDFTPFAERSSPTEVVEVLNDVFSSFDDLADKYGLEKIKTIGDSYMVVGGVPMPRPDHAEAVAEMALAMLDSMRASHPDLSLRMGLDTGSVVAGVIGRRKFSYDLWGDVVNTASRMEAHGAPNSIQVTERAADRLSHAYRLEERTVTVKGKGEMRTFFLRGRVGQGAA